MIPSMGRQHGVRQIRKYIIKHQSNICHSTLIQIQYHFKYGKQAMLAVLFGFT